MMKKIMATGLAVMMSCVYGFAPALAQTSAVVGKIQAVTAKGPNQYELVIGQEGGAVTFQIGPSAVIQVPAVAKDLKQGAMVLPVPRGGKGEKEPAQMKMPFQDMSPMEKKMLGLPDLGRMPEVPKSPEVSALPQVPKLPDIPQTPELPKVPEVPKPPKAPVSVTPGPGGVPMVNVPEETPAPKPAVQEAPKGKPAKPEVPEPVVPDKDSLAKLIPEALGPATGGPLPQTPVIQAPQPRKVLSVTQDGGKVAIEFEGAEGKKEKMTAGPEDLFLEVADPSQLKAGMKVALEVQETPSGKQVVNLRVL